MRLYDLRLGRNATTAADASATATATPSVIGIGQPRPTVSWRFEAEDGSKEKGWVQAAYELRIARGDREGRVYRVDSAANVHVPWPADEPDLASKERFTVSVRARGADKAWTDWAFIVGETALLSSADWSASSHLITTDIPPPTAVTRRPFYLRKTFTLSADALARIRASHGARVYATAHGVYDLYLNGARCGDHVLAPGWQSYKHRLHYQTYPVDAGALREGENMIAAEVGEGWYAGRLTWAAERRNCYGTELGLRLEMDLGGGERVVSDASWEWAYGPRLTSELYDGERFDVKLVDDHWAEPGGKSTLDWRGVKAEKWTDAAELIAPEAPPIRITESLQPVKVLTTPKGARILDFGQNLVGWLRIHALPRAKNAESTVTLRFAEVLDKGEIGMRPLRSAKCTDTVYLGDKEMAYEPAFTTHGFRYVAVAGVEVDVGNFTAVVVHSDLGRLATFESSHGMVNQLHKNVTWGLRGNFVGLPTDCPQRDERLGWTGDIQVFTPTASFLYDTDGFLSNWLHDLRVETITDGKMVPPVVSPDLLGGRDFPANAFPQAIWCDAITLVPGALHTAYGDKAVLAEVYDAMVGWLDQGVPRAESGLWKKGENFFQFGDWLDPTAPPENAAKAMTDPGLVADAYLVGVTRQTARIAAILDRPDDAARFNAAYDRLRAAFRSTYVTPSGRLASDGQTAYAMALHWDLLDADQVDVAVERLVWLIRQNGFKIGTGFAGTPVILQLLAKYGRLQVAYRMLQEKGCPSFLYPITMGATTVWERWDSMMPNGEINPGEMTSFNHYALGAVADFLHSVIGGIAPLDAGWKRIRVKPLPGGTITSAKVSHLSPNGRVACEWTLEGGKIKAVVTVPPNATAEVELGNREDRVKETVASGLHRWEVGYEAGEWPPKAYAAPMRPAPVINIAE